MVALATGDSEKPRKTVLQCAIMGQINYMLNKGRHSQIPVLKTLIRNKLHSMSN